MFKRASGIYWDLRYRILPIILQFAFFCSWTVPASVRKCRVHYVACGWHKSIIFKHCFVAMVKCQFRKGTLFQYKL